MGCITGLCVFQSGIIGSLGYQITFNIVSQTVTAIILQLLTIGLPMIGVTIGSDQLTGTVQTIIIVVSGIWIWVRRYQAGDIKISGVRKQLLIPTLLLATSTLLWGHPFVAFVSDEAVSTAPLSRETINILVDFYSAIYQVNPATTHKVIKCESAYNQYAVGDKGHSRGLVQIYDKYHPEISHAQAFSPMFAINYLTSEISKGRGNAWSCYRSASPQASEHQ